MFALGKLVILLPGITAEIIQVFLSEPVAVVTTEFQVVGQIL
jgi:hypothetical protein